MKNPSGHPRGQVVRGSPRVLYHAGGGRRGARRHPQVRPEQSEHARHRHVKDEPARCSFDRSNSFGGSARCTTTCFRGQFRCVFTMRHEHLFIAHLIRSLGFFLALSSFLFHIVFFFSLFSFSVQFRRPTQQRKNYRVGSLIRQIGVLHLIIQIVTFLIV